MHIEGNDCLSALAESYDGIIAATASMTCGPMPFKGRLCFT
jgi:hypothetical protein